MGNGLTILLEKEFDSIYIDKLRVIYIFEVDFKWLRKFLFTKCMVSQVTEKGIVPTKQCAKAGTNANEGPMLKTLHNDIHYTIYINSTMISADLKLVMMQSIIRSQVMRCTQWGSQY